MTELPASIRRTITVSLASLVLLGLSIGSARSQPITFPSSMSIGEDDYMLRAQSWYEESTEDPSDQGKELTDWNTRLFGMYGLSPKTSVFSRLSYIERDYDDGSTTRSEQGVSDLQIFLRRTVYERNWPRQTLSLSPYLGAELPTGSDTASGLPQGRTLGSGATDGIAGIALRDATWGKSHRFFNVEYRLNREYKDFEPGDEFNINAAIKPPLADWETDENELIGVNGMIEANLHWQDHHEHNDNTITDSGGTSLFATTGLVYTRHRTILEMAVRIPVVQNRNGNGLENDYSLLVGLWRNF